MGTIHLGMVELKGDGQFITEEFLFVFAPDQERVVENAAVPSFVTLNYLDFAFVTTYNIS